VTQPLGAIPSWEYRLDAWDDASRAELAQRLTQAGIPQEWDGSRCLVPNHLRKLVDGIVASLGRNASVAAPGWYPDPWGTSPARWWDGYQWTGFVSVADTPERTWIPPRHDRGLAMRGGGIAFLGFLAANALSLLTVFVIWLLGGSIHSLETLCAAQAALWVCLFGACKLAVRRHGNGSLRELGLARLSGRQIGAGLLVGLIARLGAGALAVALAQLFTDEQLRTTAEPVLRLNDSVLSFVALTLILVVGAPFFEELFFRGLVQGAFTNRFGARIALFGQAVCFGLVHYRVGMTAAQAVITVVTIGATGLALGATRWHYEKLGPGMVAHAFFNAVVVVVVVLAG
jgi:membrane protease YdiL (CAAX protease family)